MVTSYVRYQYNLSTSFNCEPWTWIRSYISHEKGSCHFLKLLTLKKTWAQCNRLYVSKYVLRWLDVNLIGQSTILQLVKSKGLHLICFILLQTEYIYDSDFWFDKTSNLNHKCVHFSFCGYIKNYRVKWVLRSSQKMYFKVLQAMLRGKRIIFALLPGGDERNWKCVNSIWISKNITRKIALKQSPWASQLKSECVKGEIM